MDEWQLYAARGIVKDDKFDPGQIEEALGIGLLPQIVLNQKAQNPDVIGSLGEYLKHKEISGLPIKISASGKGEFSDSDTSSIYGSIDALVELNKKAGGRVVRDVVFKAGAVHGFGEEYEAMHASGLGFLDATFGPEEYVKVMEDAKAGIEGASDYAGEHGIRILIENVGQVNYAAVPSMNPKDKPFELRDDLRWRDTIWLPKAMQLGDIGCVYDLGFLAGDDAGVCVDVEHLGQSVEYSAESNMKNVKLGQLNDSEKNVLGLFGVLMRKGLPVLYKDVVDPVEVISGLKGRIPACHIGGQVCMVYVDNGQPRIGSHMPVTFGNDPNEFIQDDRLRRRHNSMRKKKMRTYLEALHEAGCRQGVFELHLGASHIGYTGKRWKAYHETSVRNVRSILDGFS